MQITPITEAQAREVLGWRYPPPYDFYDLANADPEPILRGMLGLTSPHYAITSDRGEFVGFCSVGPEGQVPGGDYSKDALDIGIGLRPGSTGRGFGKLVLQQFLGFATTTYQPDRFRATIAAFNLRSQRTFLGLGFAQTGQFQALGTDWVILTRAAERPIPG